MNRTAIVLALGAMAPFVLAGCSKKSDGAAPTASATATVAPAATCPGGSTQDTSGCKAAGQSRVAILRWNGTFGDATQALMLKSTAAAPLKNGTVALWFYDKAGKRLDVAGAKKYAAAGDAFGGVIKAGGTKVLTFPLAKAGIPDGAATIEGEVVKATLVNPDGSDGPAWRNDDLNADERLMAATPPTAPPAVATTTVPPGVRRPAPPPPPVHR
jgi:hypothetical protein